MEIIICTVSKREMENKDGSKLFRIELLPLTSSSSTKWLDGWMKGWIIADYLRW
jgi:hypothetical protein